MKTTRIPEDIILNLTPLAERWFSTIFNAAVDNDSDALAYIRFDVRAFSKFVVQHIISYCHKRGWANVVDKTSKIVNYSDRQLRNKQKCRFK